MICAERGRGCGQRAGQTEAAVPHERRARPLQIPFHDSLRVQHGICMKIKFINSATALIRNFVVVIVLFWIVVKVMADGNVS